jgi:hypothetical protein
VATFNAIYLYDGAGNYLSFLGITNIVNCYYSTTAQALLLCVNLPSPEVDCYKVVNNAFVLQFNITASKALGALTNIACVSTDSQNVLVCWYYTGLPYATIYNYASQLAENEGALPTSLTNISSCVISSTDGSFLVGNNTYDPTVNLAANVDATAPSSNWNIYSVNPYAEKTAGTDNITSLIINNPDSVAFGVGFTTSPYAYANGFWNGYNLSTFVPGLPLTEQPLGPLQTTITYINRNLALGLSFLPENNINPTTAYLNYINASGAWVAFYELPSISAVNIGAQISINSDNYVFATTGGSLFVLSNPLTLTGASPNQIPTVPAGSDWILVSSNEGSNPITSIVWDDNLPNTGYALVAGSNNICKVIFNSSNNTYSLRQWYLTANTFNSYITQAQNAVGFNFNSTITKISISSYGVLDTLTLNNTYITNLALSRLEDYLYAVSETNNAIGIYDYKLLTTIGSSINGISPVGIVGVFTSTETTQPSNQIAFYDLQEIVNAVNTAYLSCYTALQAAITGAFPVSSCPLFSLNYTTKNLTLTYDPRFESVANNGIYASANLVQYFKLPTTAGNQTGFLQYVLSPSGSITQSQQTIYKLIFVDKIVIKTNMTLLSDFEDASNTKSNQVFTDLDIDTSDQFFNLNGSFLYSAVLLRNYILVSNSQLRSISYQIWVQYKDGSELPYLIPVGENVSIKFQFSRIY